MKCNRLKTTFFIGMVSFLFTLNANAQSSERDQQDKKRPSIDELFTKMDENEDGKLSEKEVKGPLKKDFAKIDTDEDGFITKEELEKAPKPKGKRPAKEE
ncbi:EF-hand domain-containing protein [Flavivirga aquimarina]|uniref:EF-hand domain-containing protein n=1 Tax=Flavivirga aquimarina TaxID=2027862 RepID=A0ABT8WC52_9FLAO|nr:EF-hand domain-containing protein [Flavivirga aquimarina]MDO5970695.1 EF-hand domain-containing protein [Flavivirga aquimarina]